MCNLLITIFWVLYNNHKNKRCDICTYAATYMTIQTLDPVGTHIKCNVCAFNKAVPLHSDYQLHYLVR